MIRVCESGGSKQSLRRMNIRKICEKVKEKFAFSRVTKYSDLRKLEIKIVKINI